MSKTKNLKNLYEDIYEKLSRATELIDVLDDIIDGERKANVVLKYIRENVKKALNDIEKTETLFVDFD